MKKEAAEVVAFRNRGIATTAAVDGSAPVLAKNGIKVPRGLDANRFLLDLYLNREHDTRVARLDLIPLRKQMDCDADLVSILRNPRVNFEPDMKRRLVRASAVKIQHGEFAGIEHITTVSVPFDTAEEALLERAVFEAWRDGSKRTLKTAEDWRAWEDYRDAKKARRRSGAGINVTLGGAPDVMKRMFLRALVRGLWGLGVGKRRHEDVAAWLTGCGYPTTVSAVKNATRPTSVFAEGVVAATPASLALLLVLVAEYPDLDVARLFAPSDIELVRAHLAGLVAA